MLSFIRRIIYSRVGVVITLAILVIIALAFAAGDITGLSPKGGSVLGGSIAEVGGQKVGEADLTERTKLAVSNARQENPEITTAAFVQQGGFDQVLDQLINGVAFEQFAGKHDILVNKRVVDGQIAGIPGFQGLDGKFSEETYRRVLADRRVSEKQLREDIRRETLSRWLITPTIGASQVPAKLALPYASLLLERRKGAVGIVPIQAVKPPAALDDKALAAYFQTNRSRYIIPERRSMRYAIITPARFAEKVKATDAEIAKAYQDAGKRFAATEKRNLSQVVIGDEASAKALAAKVRAGTSLGDAAKAAGLEASSVDGVEKAGYSSQASGNVANAVFAADRGAVVGPLRGGLGWYVVRVESIQQVPGKTLEQAKPELAKEIEADKTQRALADLHDRIDDGVAGGATFAEVVKDDALDAKVTGPLLAGGHKVDDPKGEVDPVMAQIAKAGFAAEEGDEPQLVQTGPDGSFALVAIDKIQPAAPPPLAEIKPLVQRDAMVDAAMKTAHDAAAAIVKKVNAGMPLAKAFAESDLRLPPPQTLDASRAELAKTGKAPPPPVALMFSMAEKKAKLLEGPNRAGWFVVFVDKITPGNAAGNKEVITATQHGLGSVVGREYAQQFANAVRRDVGVKQNPAAIAQVKAQLSGEAGGSN